MADIGRYRYLFNKIPLYRYRYIKNGRYRPIPIPIPISVQHYLIHLLKYLITLSFNMPTLSIVYKECSKNLASLHFFVLYSCSLFLRAKFVQSFLICFSPNLKGNLKLSCTCITDTYVTVMIYLFREN